MNKNTNTDILTKRVESLIDKYNMKKTGKSLVKVRKERLKLLKNI